ncbi:long-chain acyl-CoA synthetase [Nematocida minor]|uniref:long-chain acyl-CoA synthetase n=1 Tax=Nematocida minor TaxID=1912983 RepID=UPI00221F7641|nr:long-chain acyl-CoA synthetase [Nematocida minor]KAI5192257.1 long-chain acyl-CoA synthetase [Nematocida minor]
MIKESENNPKKNETSVYVHSHVKSEGKGELIEKVGKCATLFDALKSVCESHGDSNFLGRINEKEKIEYLTFKETRRYAEEVAKFILAHTDCSDKNKKPIVGICSENRPEWIIAEHATYFFSGINCPIYASFGWSATKHIFNETKMEIIFVSEKNAEKIAKNLESEDSVQVSVPKVFVLMDANLSDSAHKVLSAFGSELYYFWDIVKRCKKVTEQKPEQKKQEEKETEEKEEPISNKFKKPTEASAKRVKEHFIAPKAETVATICYTSGTTGAPKGAMLMHRNFVSVIAAFLLLSKKGVFFDIESGDRYLSFLPLAHVFERIVESALLLSKCEIIYYRGNPKQLQKDFSISKPNFFVGVPRVFNSVKAAIETKAKEKGKIANFIFTFSLLICMIFKNRVVREIFGRTVFKTIRETFGGSIKCMLSGSAPLSAPCALFFEAIFNCPMFEGYGQTETAAGNITTDIFTNEKGVIGIPFPCNKIKLVSRPESNVFAEKNQGEILMQGHSVFLGYYQQEKLTKDCFYEDNTDGKESSIYNEKGNKWVKTGDIGEITAQGNLRIIGRSKEIFKLSQGEYIIPEKIENLILAAKIKHLDDITIVGDSTRDYVIGLCTINGDIEDVKKSVTDEIFKEGDRLVQTGELIKIEIPKKFVFTNTAATIDNDLLTPSGKKIRNRIVSLFGKQIQELYNTI